MIVIPTSAGEGATKSRLVISVFFLCLIVFAPPVTSEHSANLFGIQVLAGIAAGCAGLFFALGHRPSLKRLFGFFSLPGAPLLLTAGLAAVGVLIGTANGNAFFDVFKEGAIFCLPAALFYALLIFQVSRHDGGKALVLFCVVAATIQIILLALNWENFNRYEFRLNDVLASSALIPAGVVSLLVDNKGKKRHKVLLYVLFLTGSVATLGREDVGFVVAVPLLYYLSRIKIVRKVWLYLFFLMTILPFAGLIYLTQIQDISWIESSTRWRLNEWVSYLYWLDYASPVNILFGNGLGSALMSVEVLQTYFGNSYYLLPRFHSFWLFLLFKMGIVFTAVFAVALGYMLYALSRRSRTGAVIVVALIYYFYARGSVTGLFTMGAADALLLAVLSSMAVGESHPGYRLHSGSIRR